MNKSIGFLTATVCFSFLACGHTKHFLAQYESEPLCYLATSCFAGERVTQPNFIACNSKVEPETGWEVVRAQNGNLIHQSGFQMACDRPTEGGIPKTMIAMNHSLGKNKDSKSLHQINFTQTD